MPFIFNHLTAGSNKDLARMQVILLLDLGIGLCVRVADLQKDRESTRFCILSLCLYILILYCWASKCSLFREMHFSTKEDVCYSFLPSSSTVPHSIRTSFSRLASGPPFQSSSAAIIWSKISSTMSPRPPALRLC